MSTNRIYCGQLDNEPKTVNLPVASTYSPGILVTASTTALTVATTAEANLHVLANRDFYDQSMAAAYASGDTGVAYKTRPGDVFQVRMAAATYAYDQALTVGASGYLTDAGSDDIVVAVFKDTAGAYSAGDLAKVEFVSKYTATA